MKFHAQALAKLAANNGRLDPTNEPGESIAFANRTGSLRRLLREARKERCFIALGLAALLISAGINLLMPYALGYIVKQDDTDSIVRYTALAGLVFAIGASFTFVRSYLFSFAGERLVARIRQSLFESILIQEMSFFDSTRTGELINRLAADCTFIQIASTTTIANLVRFVVQFTGGAAILLAISWNLTLVMLSPLPVLGAFAYYYSHYVKRLSHRVQLSLAESSVVAEEAISSVQYVKTFGNEEVEFARYRSCVNATFGLGKTMSLALAVMQSTAELFSYISVLIVIFYGAYLIEQGDISSSLLLSYVLYTIYTAHAIGAFSQQAGEFMRAVGASQRVFYLVDREPMIGVDGGTQPVRVNGTITFDNVSFFYPSRPETQVLDHISLTLRRGQVTALAGASGSGKSTIASLILGLYRASSGLISLDDSYLEDLDPRWLRSQIGFVSQEPVLFGTTIRENIKYGRPTATEAEVVAAAKAAHIHDFILNQLSEGYDTQVGERGARLSGGQKQRVSLARALLKNPPILILDEATSALDAESEALVQAALEVLMRSRTVLVIAHRLATIQKADCVVVMDQGRIAEKGSHAELLAKGGVYSKFVNLQAVQVQS